MESFFQTATKPGGMVAWRQNKKKLLLFTHDFFHKLVDEVLFDQGNGLQLTKFSRRISHHIDIENEYTEKYNHLQELLNQRLTEKLKKSPLLLCEFSFDDVRKEYEESKREYFTKLNDVFSSVQTKMLGVPISIAFASFKMSSIIDTSSFWQNSLLALSIAIYSIMMVLMIQNQKHSLEAVKKDYESQMTRLKHHYSEQYDLIEGIQTGLNSRYDYQKKCLKFFLVMTICLLVLVLGVFIVNLFSIDMLGFAFGVYSRVIG